MIKGSHNSLFIFIFMTKDDVVLLLLYIIRQLVQIHQKHPQKICQQTFISHNPYLKLFAMHQTLIKTVDDSKCSFESPILKPDNRRYSLYMITCRVPYSHLLPVLGSEQRFPTNITATLDSHLKFVFTFKLLLQYTCRNETVQIL